MANAVPGYTDIDFIVWRHDSDYIERLAWGNKMRSSKEGNLLEDGTTAISFRLLLTPEELTFVLLKWPQSVQAKGEEVDPELDIPPLAVPDFLSEHQVPPRKG